MLRTGADLERFLLIGREEADDSIAEYREAGSARVVGEQRAPCTHVGRGFAGIVDGI